jgi:transposase
MQENACFIFWVGVDVSKDSFTAAFRSVARNEATRFPPRDRYAVDRNGVREFLQWADGLSGGLGFGIAMESTGVYSRRLAALIRSVSPSRHVAVCNAASVSLYARSFTEQKSDRSDAELIARYACDRNPRAPRPKDATEERLRELVRERDRIVGLKTDMDNSGGALESADARRIHAAAAKALEKAIERLDTLIRETVASSKNLGEEVARMATAPGVGFLSAACIYAELGSMRNYTRRQISAMSGVCPVNRVSGTSLDRHAVSRRGSRLLRKILFLDSHQAIQRMPAMGEFHRRMLEKPNSSKMSAKCACMRKLLLILHAMVVNETDFRPDYKSEKIIKKTDETA